MLTRFAISSTDIYREPTVYSPTETVQKRFQLSLSRFSQVRCVVIYTRSLEESKDSALPPRAASPCMISRAIDQHGQFRWLTWGCVTRPEHQGQGQRGLTHRGTKQRQGSGTMTFECKVVVGSQTPVESHVPCGHGIPVMRRSRMCSGMESSHY